jgi:hypothetical protein
VLQQHQALWSPFEEIQKAGLAAQRASRKRCRRDAGRRASARSTAAMCLFSRDAHVESGAAVLRQVAHDQLHWMAALLCVQPRVLAYDVLHIRMLRAVDAVLTGQRPCGSGCGKHSCTRAAD